MSSNIKVCVRVRPIHPSDTPFTFQKQPLSNSQLLKDSKKILSVLDDRALLFDPIDSKKDKPRDYSHSSRRKKEIPYTFDRVFNESSTQQQVFEDTTLPLIDSVLEGFNATVFAYGATGCGKTYTITGTEQDPGIIYRSVQRLFERIESSHKSVDVSLSFLEVYNETIKDLLSPSNLCLDLREDDTKVVVNGLSHHHPNDLAHIMEMLIQGNNNRTKAFTEANQTSSRSHAVLQINVKNRPHTLGSSVSVNTATLNIIDLAGSEVKLLFGINVRELHRQRIKVNRMVLFIPGERLLEGANINRSLLALGNCINALCVNKQSHVPYRDSKLTRLLKYSLQGNCKVVMIANVSPLPIHYEETNNTLKYANRSKNIKTLVEKNSIKVDFNLSAYPQIIQSLETQINVLKIQLENNHKNESTMNQKSESRVLFNEIISELRECYRKLGERETLKVQAMHHIENNEQRIESLNEISIHLQKIQVNQVNTPQSISLQELISKEIDLSQAINVTLKHNLNTLEEKCLSMRIQIRKSTIKELSEYENNQLNIEIGQFELILHNMKVSKQLSLYKSQFNELNQLHKQLFMQMEFGGIEIGLNVLYGFQNDLCGNFNDESLLCEDDSYYSAKSINETNDNETNNNERNDCEEMDIVHQETTPVPTVVVNLFEKASNQCMSPIIKKVMDEPIQFDFHKVAPPACIKEMDFIKESPAINRIKGMDFVKESPAIKRIKGMDFVKESPAIKRIKLQEMTTPRKRNQKEISSPTNSRVKNGQKNQSLESPSKRNTPEMGSMNSCGPIRSSSISRLSRQESGPVQSPAKIKRHPRKSLIPVFSNVKPDKLDKLDIISEIQVSKNGSNTLGRRSERNKIH